MYRNVKSQAQRRPFFGNFATCSSRVHPTRWIGSLLQLVNRDVACNQPVDDERPINPGKLLRFWTLTSRPYVTGIGLEFFM